MMTSDGPYARVVRGLASLAAAVDGERGNPVCFGERWFADLCDVDGDTARVGKIAPSRWSRPRTRV